MRTLILASTSQYRRALLERLRTPFETEHPEVSEDPVAGESPSDRALRLSVAKAEAVASRHPNAVIIGSDQVAAAATGKILDKPGNAENCRTQLSLLSGTVAKFYTGCSVIGLSAGIRLAHVDITTVYVRTLKTSEIDRYIGAEKPFDCAGGFKSEALGVTLFESIESIDPTALIGLPLIWLSSALRSAGYPLP